jgi:hypothetical protein
LWAPHDPACLAATLGTATVVPLDWPAIRDRNAATWNDPEPTSKDSTDQRDVVSG